MHSAYAKPRYHPPIAQGALIHMGAIMTAHASEEKFGIKKPLPRTLTYTLATACASFVNDYLRQRQHEQVQHARS